jgi:hypothetical protein
MRVVATTVAAIASVLVASGCGSSGKKATEPTNSFGGGPAAAIIARNHEVQVARSSNRLFSIFPAVPGKRQCSIPDGAPGAKPFRGTCQTSVHPARTHEPAVIVTFTERWRWPPCPRKGDCIAARNLRHTWHVIEGEPIVKPGARLRVLATRSNGATAPQYYK